MPVIKRRQQFLILQMDGAGFQGAKTGNMAEEPVGGFVFRPLFAFFTVADKLGIFKVTPIFCDDFAMREQGVGRMSHGPPVTVLSQKDVGRIMV